MVHVPKGVKSMLYISICVYLRVCVCLYVFALCKRIRCEKWACGLHISMENRLDLHQHHVCNSMKKHVRKMLASGLDIKIPGIHKLKLIKKLI